MLTTKDKETLEKLDFNVITQVEFDKMKHERPMIGVAVHVSMPELKENILEGVVISRPTQRKTVVYAGGFEHDKGQFYLALATEVPQSYIDIYGMDFIKKYRDDVNSDSKKVIATTFPDFCWIVSEGTTRLNVGEVNTKPDEHAILGDLTWILPSKFCDDIIEMMHSLNLNLLEGFMQDAILYGPLFKLPND